MTWISVDLFTDIIAALLMSLMSSHGCLSSGGGGDGFLNRSRLPPSPPQQLYSSRCLFMTVAAAGETTVEPVLFVVTESASVYGSEKACVWLC